MTTKGKTPPEFLLRKNIKKRRGEKLKIFQENKTWQRAAKVTR
jgi:hypothetical protein